MAREMRSLVSPLSAQLYGLDVVAENISFAGEALSGAETSSSGTPGPVAFDHDSRTLAISPPREAMNRLQGDWDHLNPSRLYPQACLCQFRQPMHKRLEAPKPNQKKLVQVPTFHMARVTVVETMGSGRTTHT